LIFSQFLFLSRSSVMVALSHCLGCLAVMVSSVNGIRIATKRTRAGLDGTACGVKRSLPNSEVNMSIVNGRPAAECAWPWQIHLGGCGGTVHSSRRSGWCPRLIAAIRRQLGRASETSLAQQVARVEVWCKSSTIHHTLDAPMTSGC